MNKQIELKAWIIHKLTAYLMLRYDIIMKIRDFQCVCVCLDQFYLVASHLFLTVMIDENTLC